MTSREEHIGKLQALPGELVSQPWKISYHAYDHKLQENGLVVADDTYDSFLENHVYKVGPDQYFTTSDVDANYVRSASTTHDSNDSYKFQPYTKIVYKGQAQARAMHLEIDL